MLFPQPDTRTVAEPIEQLDGPCPECGAPTVARYTLVDYRGWLRVTKCRSCLHVVDSERIQPPAQAG
jgi:hypothetical protein